MTVKVYCVIRQASFASCVIGQATLSKRVSKLACSKTGNQFELPLNPRGLYLLTDSAVVVMRRGKTESCWASQHEMQHEALWPIVGAAKVNFGGNWGRLNSGSCKPQSCQKQKDNYSADLHK